MLSLLNVLNWVYILINNVFLKGSSDQYSHDEQFREMAIDLLQLRNSDSILNLDIGLSMSDFDEAVRDPKNPLKQGLPLSSKNIFIDILKFALEHNKDLIYTILCHTTPGDCDFGEEEVIGTAMTYMYMSSRMNNRNTTFSKLQGVLLQSCGLNETAPQAMSKL